MKLVYQKYICLFILFSLNLLLATTFIYYSDKWYAFIFILMLMSILNSFSSILLLCHKMVYDTIINHRTKPLNYIYIVPCYNESKEELLQSLESLVYQRTVEGDKRCIMIICDGMVIGQGNINTTDVILKNILNNNNLPNKYSYTTWDNKVNTIEIYTGIFNNLNYILIVKTANYGKRDSLVLARKLCYNYNNKILNDSMISNDLMYSIGLKFVNIYNNDIKYIIGIDADTVFDYDCSYELIMGIEKDSYIHGCVGLVNISPKMNKFSPFILYQYAEYIFAQCLKRQAQSKITHKVNCLSGCNQILRVSEETCGNEILSKFNYLPKDEENIFNHIRSYASEDRNHVCLMLSMYPHVKTVQTLKAIAYTSVPTNFSVFFSQRRRWSLGSNTNDMLLIQLPNINIFEKISSFVNLLIYSLCPFIFIATVIFIKTIITNPTYLMLLLAIIMLITLFYALLIPIFILQMSFRNALYYYLSLIIFFTVGSFINLIIFFNSVFNMDIIKWGKTRTINKSIIIKNDNDIDIDIINNLENDINNTDTDIVNNLENDINNTDIDIVNNLEYDDQFYDYKIYTHKYKEIYV